MRFDPKEATQLFDLFNVRFLNCDLFNTAIQSLQLFIEPKIRCKILR